jgi:ribosomal protein L37E
MKLPVLAVGVVIGLLTVGFVGMPSDQPTQKKGAPKGQAKGVRSVYACPMHPKVTSTRPGKCSDCGMPLVKKVRKPMQQAKDNYVCPMHPEVTSAKLGKCSKCGMALVKKGAEIHSTSKRQVRMSDAS